MEEKELLLVLFPDELAVLDSIDTISLRPGIVAADGRFRRGGGIREFFISSSGGACEWLAIIMRAGSDDGTRVAAARPGARPIRSIDSDSSSFPAAFSVAREGNKGPWADGSRFVAALPTPPRHWLMPPSLPSSSLAILYLSTSLRT